MYNERPRIDLGWEIQNLVKSLLWPVSGIFLDSRLRLEISEPSFQMGNITIYHKASHPCRRSIPKITLYNSALICKPFSPTIFLTAAIGVSSWLQAYQKETPRGPSNSRQCRYPP